MRPSPQPLHQTDAVVTLDALSAQHGPILGSRALNWPDEGACAALAAALALRPALREAFIELHGPLGAGKTTFARHLLRALGLSGRVKSPTYTVVETHSLPGLEVAHFDFYRFADPREWVDAGLREMFASPGLKLAEWADKARPLLPQADLRILIEPQDDETRSVRLQALTPRGLELLA